MSMRSMNLFLAGDVMTGRGVDQIFSHPSDPVLYEPYLTDARDYVSLAEKAHGPIPRPVAPDYVWGDALAELVHADLRIVNLETAVTRSEDAWPSKEINYRMHPENLACLGAAGIDAGVLANNHVLDWGAAGLNETLVTLARAGIQTVGAGRNLDEACRAARIESHAGSLLLFAIASETSGVPLAWQATETRVGIDLVPDLSDASADAIVERVRDAERPGDRVVLSIHWGSNWGYAVPRDFVHFAHRLVDGGVDLVHGHSSHHPRPIEVYRDRLILYGCGDLINDYEGISGYERYRDDLVLLYFATVEVTGALLQLRMVPMQLHRMRLRRASADDVGWMAQTLGRICGGFGSSIVADGDALALRWHSAR